MSAVVSIYHFNPKASAAFAELDEVRLLVDARTKYGSTVPAGSAGTILSVWADGAAYVVEFDEGLATIDAENLIARD